MAFQCELMVDPVVASDGYTYERESIEQWMTHHNTSPLSKQPFVNKNLVPNHDKRQQIIAWCEQNGVPVPPPPPKPTDKPAAAGGGAAVQPLLQKPVVMCARHPEERLRVLCLDCGHGVCVLCAVDTDQCKTHTTKAFDPLLKELKTDREGWAHALQECDGGAEQVCADIHADGDAKKQAIDREVAALKQQVRSAAAARSTDFRAIVVMREEREELVAGATIHPEVAVKGSAAAAVILSVLNRPKTAVPPASAAQFRATYAPAAAVGHVTLAAAVVDPEDAVSSRCPQLHALLNL